MTNSPPRFSNISVQFCGHTYIQHNCPSTSFTPREFTLALGFDIIHRMRTLRAQMKRSFSKEPSLHVRKIHKTSHERHGRWNGNTSTTKDVV